MTSDYAILHHGAIDGVTGSCHQLKLADGRSLLIDCGLFQGAEVSGSGAGANQLAIEFPLDGVLALVVTHVHIDHVGRIPYLVAAGFRGPIYCTEASAELLPLVLEDALKVGVTRNERIIEQVLQQVVSQIVALPYKQWRSVDTLAEQNWLIKLHPAGHILGSAYVEVQLRGALAKSSADRRWHILFSGDLGAPYTPLLPAPQSPWRADQVVLESTYGDRNHVGRATRLKQFKGVIEKALRNRGTLIIPAFSIGRTQEILYELEGLIAKYGDEAVASDLPWRELEIIIDSPLAAKMTAAYRHLRDHWDAEAKRRVAQGRHPLAFEQLLTVDDHASHLRIVDYLKRSGRPAIVIAASGMCAGGRVVNYLKSLLGDARTDVAFVGYQASGTPGAVIQKYGPRGGYVDFDGERITIRAGIHTLNGYSAHADQTGLLRFVQRIHKGDKRVRLVHGDAEAKAELARAFAAVGIAVD
ncbi:MAG: MBL fold metallo-hydrolase [Gammaproteobacteria bacterium]|nr:MBL fold metallo-hydrolase [Gammaproteobacteria bacterium]